MPERVTRNRLNEFISSLERLDGSAGNGRLRHELGWDEEFYWKVQGLLVEEGRIVPGRGKGGSVRLTEAETEHSQEQDTSTNPDRSPPSKRLAERELYDPLRHTIESTWIKRFGFDDVRVDETHSQGSKATGGTFTRPDITAAGIRRYVFLPKRLEIITFEVKAGDCVDVMGVLEAIAHKEAAHRSYVIYALSRVSFDSQAEAERIMELAQKYGIGLILTENPQNVETWEIGLDAARHEPDPARLDRFLGDLPSEPMKKQLHKWKE